MAQRKKTAAKKAAPRSKSKSAPDPIIQKILLLLEHRQHNRRTAAAIVLGELKVKDADALDALREASTRTDDAELRRCAAEAIGTIAPKSIVKDLSPLLKDPDRSVRDTVRAVLASGKGVKPEDIGKMLEGRDEKQKLAAIAVLGAMGVPLADTRRSSSGTENDPRAESRRMLLSQIRGGKSKIVDAAVNALRPSLLSSSGEEAERAILDIERLLDPEAIVQDPGFALVLVQLLGCVSDESAVTVLLKIAESAAEPEVRGSAIEAMRRGIKGKKASKRSFRFLLECVENVELPSSIITPALETLTGLDLPIAFEPRVRGLVAVESTPIRRWALHALGGLDTSPAARALAQVVQDGDPGDREAALEAAIRTPNGRIALGKLIGQMTDETRARAVANGLRTHASELADVTLHVLEESVLEAQPDVAQVIIDLLKQCSGRSVGRVQDSLFDRAIKLKKKSNYADAAELFRRICQGQSADPEARFQLGICELKLSKRVISRGPKNDPCLQTFNTLLKVRDFPMVDRLKDEPLTGPEDLYYLGFSLAEGNAEEQGLGGDILMVLAESGTDEKLAKMAHNKLVTMGWVE